MFPLNSNQAYIKETGERSTLGAVIRSGGSGSSELPEYGIADAGKVLMVDNTGNLVWGTVSGGGSNFTRGNIHVTARSASVSAKEVTT